MKFTKSRKLKQRSAMAVVAMHRHSAIFHHKCKPKGGANNEMAEYMAEYDEIEMNEDHDIMIQKSDMEYEERLFQMLEAENDAWLYDDDN